MSKLIALASVQSEIPEWPMASWVTARLIREGKLGCVRVGRRVYVTRELIEAFIARHTALSAVAK
jgi:hypothetical protein